MKLPAFARSLAGRVFPPAGARFYRCPACGHQMSYGELRCDACSEEAPVYNRPIFWGAFWIAIPAVLAWAVWALYA